MLAPMRVLLFALAACGGDIVNPPVDSGEPVDQGLAIDNLDPAEGPEAGGTLVRVTGQSFTTGSSVAVGGTSCASTTFLSSTEMLCVTPPGTGEVQLTVDDPAGQATAAFTYLPEVVDTAPEDTGDPPAVIDGCLLLEPTSLAMEAYDYTEDLSASVTVLGRTDGDGEGPGIDGQVGHGDAGTDPDSWIWETVYYASSDGNADVYTDSFYMEDVGQSEFSFRFRVDYGEWTTCTTSSGTYGSIEVSPADIEIDVDYCHVQWPCSTTAAAGTESEPIYAWIYQYGVTQGEGQGEGVTMYVGVGKAGTDPETDASWAWYPMDYNVDTDGLSQGDLANDEYMGNFLAPAAAGTYDYAVRASADYELSFTVCDLGGDACNYGGSGDGYDDPGICTVE